MMNLYCPQHPTTFNNEPRRLEKNCKLNDFNKYTREHDIIITRKIKLNNFLKPHDMGLIFTSFGCNLLFNYQAFTNACTDDINKIKYSIL